jgi:hypothetical protein
LTPSPCFWRGTPGIEARFVLLNAECPMPNARFDLTSFLSFSIVQVLCFLSRADYRALTLVFSF